MTTQPQSEAPFFFFHLPRTAGTTLNAILKDNFRNSGFISGDMDKPSVNFKTIDSSHCKLPQFIIPDRTYDIALTTELAYMPCNIKRSSS